MHWVKKVTYLKDYLLKVEFENNKTKVVDLGSYVGGKGIFEPLKDFEYFKKVRIDDCGNTICWDNGADICPNSLYEITSVSI